MREEIDFTTGEVLESADDLEFETTWMKLRTAQSPQWLQHATDSLGGLIGERWGVESVEYARGEGVSSARCEFVHRTHRDKIEVNINARLTRNQLWLLALYEAVVLNGYSYAARGNGKMAFLGFGSETGGDNADDRRRHDGGSEGGVVDGGPGDGGRA